MGFWVSRKINKRKRRNKRTSRKIKGGNSSESGKSCIYISLSGISLSCDVIVAGNPDSSNISFTPPTTDYYTIYCNPTFMDCKSILDKINNKYILIIGGSDKTFPEEVLGDNSDKYINDEKCIQIFAVNSRISSGKVNQMPIGIDYATLSGIEAWGMGVTKAKKQEEELQSVKDISLPFFQRKIVCYANFSLTDEVLKLRKYGYNRKDAIKSIPNELIYFQQDKIPRIETWKKQSEYAFVISPLGNGMDCHRTWEALCLGCIVIVKTSFLDPMYEGLPVLIVNSWSDITQDLLNNTVNSFKDKAFNYDKLLLSYWVNKINSYKK